MVKKIKVTVPKNGGRAVSSCQVLVTRSWLQAGNNTLGSLAGGRGDMVEVGATVRPGEGKTCGGGRGGGGQEWERKNLMSEQSLRGGPLLTP